MVKNRVAFFDVDHTISRITTSLAFIFVCIEKGYIKARYIIAAPFLYVFYRLSKLDIEKLYKFSLSKIKGLTRQELEVVANIAFEKHVKKSIYCEAVQEIENLKQKGIRVVLATSSPFEAVYPLAQYCGLTASDIVATTLAYESDVFMGRLVGVPVYSENKKKIIKTFIENANIDKKHCSFYTDSIHDLPLLEAIGMPIATNPDYRLRKLAKKRKWLIKDFDK